jgi:hypothetical protein
MRAHEGEEKIAREGECKRVASTYSFLSISSVRKLCSS